MLHSFFAPRSYRVVGLITITAVYFLILVGGIVRASGAGMGCPDWPKCFGRWIPPTNESQLPANYQEIYRDRGYADTTFNPVKTWTEYINRLIGVTIGFLIFLTLVSSFGYARTDPRITVLSAVCFLLVGFEGWLGSVVVSSNLVPVIITLHMAAALVLVSLLIFTVMRAQRDRYRQNPIPTARIISVLFAVVLTLSIAQIVLGTRVREHTDQITAAFEGLDATRSAADFGIVFYVHRSLSILVLAVNIALAYELMKRAAPPAMRAAAAALLGLLITEIASGAALSYMGMPAVLQPVHLLLSNLIFGAQFYLWTAYRYARYGPESQVQPV